MQITLAQVNSLIGDISKNGKKAISIIQKNQSSDLIIFPELFLWGYPPEDLIYLSDLHQEQAKIINQIIEIIPEGMLVSLGGIDLDHPKIFNTLFIVTKNKIFNKVYKSLLPNYDVFDEKRHFVSSLGRNSNFHPPSSELKHPLNLVDWKGFKLLFTICKDIWPSDFNPTKDEIGDIKKNPLLNRYRNEKIDLIINASASPFYLGKAAIRKQVGKKFSTSFLHQPRLIYLNSVGGQDALIFDGGSFVLAGGNKGKNSSSQLQTISTLAYFKEECKTIDFSQKKSYPEFKRKLYSKEEYWFKAIALGLKDFIKKNAFKKVVIGLSGGIDSALVATIATLTLSPRQVKVVELPSQFTSAISFKAAEALRSNLNLRKNLIPIQKIVDEFKWLLQKQLKGAITPLTEENLQARIRAVFLMSITNEITNQGKNNRALLLNTSNKSELAVGYGTQYGDLTGGLSIIGDLFKTEVYQLSKWINQKYSGLIPESILLREPSAELKDNQIDKDSLPDYEILDEILKKYLMDGFSLKKFILAGFKQKLVKNIINRVKNSEFKRKQFPPILKLSKKSFGMGRRIPITKKVNLFF